MTKTPGTNPEPTQNPTGTTIVATVAGRYRLEFIVGDVWIVEGQRTTISADRIVIGTRLEGDVQIAIDEVSVSQPQGEFTVVEGRLKYRDLGSRYGTVFLDGMEELAFLHPVGRPTEFSFPERLYGKRVTFQVGQIGVWLKVEKM